MSARLISVPEAARSVDVGERTLWRWIADGHLPAYRMGERLTRVKPEDVEALARPIHPVPARAVHIETAGATPDAA